MKRPKAAHPTHSPKNTATGSQCQSKNKERWPSYLPPLVCSVQKSTWNRRVQSSETALQTLPAPLPASTATITKITPGEPHDLVWSGVPSSSATFGPVLAALSHTWLNGPANSTAFW
mmetsp:Transcript_64903/g.108756  ORF Transcript_64903/g.108756 Transcript_64903/m.108756 type:complete len:117 (-) Transcript_64903:585-935(-)